MFFLGSTDGELTAQDGITATQGRLADPARADEVVVTASGARQLRVHVGSVIRLGLFPDHSESNPVDVLRKDVKVVGVVDLDNQIVQDDIDAAFGFVMLTPALEREVASIAPSTVSPTTYALQLDHGVGDVSAVERELVRVIPPGQQYEFHALAPIVTQTEDSIKPESIALGAFGALAALVALVIAAQAISRQLRSGDHEREVLRALGAGPKVAVADGLVGVLAAVVVGALLAVVVAVALSPLTPLGPVRPVYPTPGLAFDWTVLGFGLALFIVALGGIAAVIAFRRAPHRLAGRRALQSGRRSRFVEAAANSGLPAPAVVGIGFALDPGDGPTAVPMRSTLLGTVVAVALVVGTITFASGLRTLVSHPALYGWNWTYQIAPSVEVPPVTRTLLAHDHDVAQWTPMRYSVAELDGQNVPLLLGTAKAKIAPPVLSGHGVESTHDIVIGATTLARLHKHVGDTAVLTYGAPDQAPAYIPPTRLHIVGTATFPAIGFTSFVADHTSMGTGALVSFDVEPLAFRQSQIQPDPNLNGPDLVFLRIRSGVSTADARADMARITRATDKVLNADPNTTGDNILVEGVQRPAQIVNYKTIGAAPVLLAAGLAAGAIVALALTLSASVRRRRRDLALLKTLGFTRRQLAASVAWQASVAALVGVVVGVPVGILMGRWLWTEFAREIAALPRPTVPVLAVIGVAVGTFVLANLVAALPGRQAARTRSALLFQPE